jgi:hypothetical protein
MPAATTAAALADLMSRIRSLEDTVAAYERAETDHAALIVARADVLASIGWLISVAQDDERTRLHTQKTQK